MDPQKHLYLLMQGIAAWTIFWLAGLPLYYQQYAQLTIAVGCSLLSVAISLTALVVLLRGREETRLRRALWISVYYTLPFAVLDTLYCALYLGHGASFLRTYWYLTIFYATPWLTFVPTALLLRNVRRSTD